MDREAALASYRTETVVVDGCRIEMLRGGDGAPLLFLHGAGGAGAWLPFMEQLSQRFDVIVPEHPGYGGSETPDWLDELSDLAYFYLDFMRALGLDGVHAVGNSLGGWIAAEIAARDTARLRTLTLVDAAGIHVKGVRKGDIFLWAPEERVRNLFVDQSFADARLAVEPTEEMADILLKNEFTTAKLAWEPRFYSRQLRKWLHRIDVPTLIVWGDSDKIFPVDHAHAYQALIPGSRVEIIPQCGHVPQVEKADRFVEILGAFIDGAAA